jgi:hypothetical protein
MKSLVLAARERLPHCSAQFSVYCLLLKRCALADQCTLTVNWKGTLESAPQLKR